MLFRLSTFIVQQVNKHNRKAKPLESHYKYLLADKLKHEGQKRSMRVRNRSEIKTLFWWFDGFILILPPVGVRAVPTVTPTGLGDELSRSSPLRSLKRPGSGD